MALAILFPADKREPLSVRNYTTLEDYQSVMDGYIEAVPAGSDGLSFFARDDAKLAGLPVNHRATLYWWLHVPSIRHEDVLCGNAVLVGPADARGNTRDVPERVRGLLLEPATYRVEVQLKTSREWRIMPQGFRSYLDASDHAIALLLRGRSVTDVRVMPQP
jgi:hypothetical protein